MEIGGLLQGCRVLPPILPVTIGQMLQRLTGKRYIHAESWVGSPLRLTLTNVVIVICNLASSPRFVRIVKFLTVKLRLNITFSLHGIALASSSEFSFGLACNTIRHQTYPS